MLMPRKYKYRKSQKLRNKGVSKLGTQLEFGDYGLKALGNTWLTSRQIEAARIAITRHMKRAGRIWIMVFPHKPVTKKPAETRMGKGKGDLDHYVAVVKRGKILFEITGVSEEIAVEALRLASHKLPIKCKIVKKIMGGV